MTPRREFEEFETCVLYRIERNYSYQVMHVRVQLLPPFPHFFNLGLVIVSEGEFVRSADGSYGIADTTRKDRDSLRFKNLSSVGAVVKLDLHVTNSDHIADSDWWKILEFQAQNIELEKKI